MDVSTDAVGHVPGWLFNAAAQGAIRLGRALEVLEWPNGAATDAPCHEVNALIGFQGQLAQLDPPFHIYSEARIRERERIDMVACNGEVALAIEAKSFGKINPKSSSIAADIERMRSFQPQYFTKHGREVNDWWRAAEQRWAVVLITSFRGDSVRDAWDATDDMLALDMMQTYSRAEDRPKPDGSGFTALRSIPDMARFSVPISLGDRWGDDGRGWLLCGAIPLP